MSLEGIVPRHSVKESWKDFGDICRWAMAIVDQQLLQLLSREVREDY